MGELGKKGVSAAKWGALSTVSRFALQLLAQIVLARILGPETYGLFAMGLVVLTLSNFVADFGFGWSLVQKPKLTPEHIRLAFTWQMITGLLAAALLYLGAPWIAAFFHEPRVEPIVRWLSLACVFNAGSAPCMALLQRDMNFKVHGMIQTWGYAVGYLLVGIPLALLGFGAETLVAAWLVQSGFVLVASWIKRPLPSRRPLLWGPQATDLLRTSSTVFVTNLCNWFLANMDRMLIGRMLNARFLGFYTVGFNLANLPNSLLLSAIQPAFLSAGARMEGDVDRLRAAYLEVVAAIGVLVLPAFVLMACAAPHVIALLYGAAWRDSADVLRILFLAMPMFILWGMSTPILWNTGRSHLESLLQLPILVVGLGLYLAFAGTGIIEATLVTAAILVLRGLVLCGAAVRALRAPASALWPELGRGVVLGALTAIGAGVGSRLAGEGRFALVGLIGTCAAGLVLPSLYLWIRPQALGFRAARMIGRFLPGAVRERFGGTPIVAFVCAAAP